MNSKNSFIIMVLSLSVIVGACSSNQKKQMKADSYLDDKVTATRVENTLHKNQSYTFPNVHATATNGVVYLTGNVQTEEQRMLAEQLAREIHRAKDVRNELAVKQ